MKLTRKCCPLTAGVSATIALALAAAGCDFSVTNPGPVQDEFLNDAGAFDAILMGANRSVTTAWTDLAFSAGIVSREVTPAGVQLGGGDAQLIQGRLTSDNVDEHWQQMHQGRWVSEDGVRRLREILGEEFDRDSVAAALLLHAAYANVILGENMCIAVIDGGPAEDHTVHFERAQDQFTEALEIASSLDSRDQELAALAGRATARIWLDDWAGAIADAGQVPTDFDFAVEFFGEGYDENTNEFNFQQAGLPWRVWTVWGTFAEDYYQQTGDPRTAWTTDAANPTTAVGSLPLYLQLKYPELTSPMTLADGREMRLLEAEYALRQQRLADGMEIMNQIRTSVISQSTGEPLAAWQASTIEEAWIALEKERRIELWLEGKRLPDIRRWTADGTPGQLEDMTGRSLCFPVGTTEIDTNPNSLPEVH